MDSAFLVEKKQTEEETWRKAKLGRRHCNKMELKTSARSVIHFISFFFWVGGGGVELAHILENLVINCSRK